MLKIGVLGAGHLGSIHIKLLKEIEQFEITGFYDPDDVASKKAIKQLGVKKFNSVDELIEANDVVDIVTTTLSHFECAEKSLRKSKHIFIEKPLTNTLEEAKKLLDLSKEANVKVQVGHVERFNPAFIAAEPHLSSPMFIEAHRLSQFNPRGTDVSVVLDLMIHDIDIILSVVKSNIKRISASGVAVVSDTPDIASARIEFDNGCVANITASRISLHNMRKTRFFQKNAYIAVDFLHKKLDVIKLKKVNGEKIPGALIINPEDKNPKQVVFHNPEIADTNAIKSELEIFASCIINNTNPPITVDDGYYALDVANKVLEKMKSSSPIIENL
jgi:predicted dehydrogenase